MIFDTHSHCYFEKLTVRIDEVYTTMLASNVTHAVQIGCDISSSLAAIELARKYPNWYATVGYHPVDAQNPKLSKDRAGGKIITLGEADSEYAALPSHDEIDQGLRKLIIEHRDRVVAI